MILLRDELEMRSDKWLSDPKEPFLDVCVYCLQMFYAITFPLRNIIVY